MNDRELLELAAKAAGLTGECHLLTGDCSDPAEPGGFRYDHPDGGHDWWNPLMDDGDALRLALQLRIRFARHLQPFVAAFAPDIVGRFEESEGDDICAATRRAIVRAAAAIGEAMQ